jgi:hypothetical protein
MSSIPPDATEAIRAAVREAIREVVLKPMIAEIIAGTNFSVSSAECCQRTRLRGAPCPAGRTCPYDTPAPAGWDEGTCNR